MVSYDYNKGHGEVYLVLILIVMDNGLLQRLFLGGGTPAGEVLILIVLANGLLRLFLGGGTHAVAS